MTEKSDVPVMHVREGMSAGFCGPILDFIDKPYPDGKPYVIVEKRMGPYGVMTSEVCRGIGGYSRILDTVMTFPTRELAEDFARTMRDPLNGFDPDRPDTGVRYVVELWL